MDVKVSELSGAALDWTVAMCEGRDYVKGETCYATDGRLYQRGTFSIEGPRYSFDWAQGGLIIEREGIGTWPSAREGNEGQWGARMADAYIAYGPTPLIAAMRCYVASKLGDVVSIPDELL